ncbi:MAG TPA: LysR family transcriptional regulator [Caldimonas sp.]|jgi:DNA-binding transcriptional LysR family regulator|nr:LysR family transcriptional regulator [Caldimonas sp.]HEX2539660.1 LysR family transcriptional regulator [Caldimonas sp.]
MTDRSPLNIRHLRAFLALAEHRHFTRAAAALFISQPAFSALIGSLETSLGLRLFDRSTRHVSLTPDGAAFEVPARRAVAEFDGALAGIGNRVRLKQGSVAIALLPSLAADWLPPVLRAFRAAYPDIATDVIDVLSDACLEQVASGRADFALTAVRADTSELKAELFCADDFHLVCRADHPLATRRELRVRDLAAWPFVHLARTSSVRQYLEAALQPVSMQTVMEVEQLATVMGMVRAGVGISVVPALTLFHFRDPAIATLPLRLPGLHRRIYLVTRRDRSLSVAAARLRDEVLAARPPRASGRTGRPVSRAPRSSC